MKFKRNHARKHKFLELSCLPTYKWILQRLIICAEFFHIHRQINMRFLFVYWSYNQQNSCCWYLLNIHSIINTKKLWWLKQHRFKKGRPYIPSWMWWMGFFDDKWNVHLLKQRVGLQLSRFHFVYECVKINS